MWNARTSRPSFIGLASSGIPFGSNLKPSPRPSIPNRPSNEWFSIITMPMCSIFGIVAEPWVGVGFGRDPGLLKTCGAVDGADVVAVPPLGVVVGGVDFVADDEQL